MNRTNRILSVLLAVQLVLAVVIFWPRGAAGEVEAGPLLADYNADDVTALVIRDDAGNTVSLAKDDEGAWVLPEADDYPAQTSRIDSVLDRLTGFSRSRLISRSAANHNRLEVGGDTYQRLLEITQGGQTTRLYLGTSEGSSASHMRINDEPEVYLVDGLASWEITAQVSSWIDTTYFSVNQDEIATISVENANGTFAFEKHLGEWTYTGLEEGEEFDPDSISALLRQAAALRITRPLGREALDEYGTDTPQATVTLTVVREMPVEESATEDAAVEGDGEEATEEASAEDGEAEATPATETVTEVYTLLVGARLGETEDSGDYVMLASNSDYYVAVAPFTAETFTGLARDALLVPPPTETPTDAPANGD